MTERKQQVIALVDMDNAGFAKNYQYGYWWAMHGKRESKGPLEDQ